MARASRNAEYNQCGIKAKKDIRIIANYGNIIPGSLKIIKKLQKGK